MGWLYMIRCRTSGEYYIGASTRELRFRFAEHRTQLGRGVCTIPLLQAAHDRYGEDSLDYVPLREFPDAELLQREREAIETLKPALNTDAARGRKPYQRWPLIVVQGEEMSMEDAARKFDIVYQTIRARYRKGVRGDALVAPPHAAPRKPYVRRR